MQRTLSRHIHMRHTITAFTTALPLRVLRPRPLRCSLTTMTSSPSPIGIARLTFASTFTENLPSDSRSDNDTRPVLNAAYSLVSPSDPLQDDISAAWSAALASGQVRPAPQGDPILEKALIAWSPACASLFDLTSEYPHSSELPAVLDVLGGFGPIWPGMRPYAMCYGGHQFGSWAGQLGDGRAISMGEYVNKAGLRWEIQLKGAGKTPYSRFADGRAVLRSSIREFLCSEAMFHLGVPTTRALSLVATGAGIIRDMFYSGSPQMEAGAVVARVAPSFLRLGNFQLATDRGDRSLLTATAEYAINMHFPELKHLPTETEGSAPGRYTAFVREVAKRNADMVAKWQGVGFVHGVMNTDNFSILGLTIDYGPYGYLDSYDPEYTPNTTDLPGRRYKFSTQPKVAHWNILQFAKSMVPLCGHNNLEGIVEGFEDVYQASFRLVMAKKLGLASFVGDEDMNLLNSLYDCMADSKADHTNVWRALSSISSASTTAECKNWCSALSLDNDKEDVWLTWLSKYIERLQSNGGLSNEERVKLMNASNPVYILRNYMAQTAIEKAEKGDYSEVRRLYDLLSKPYEEQEGMQKYTSKPPTWASRKGVSVNSCSS